MAYKEKRREGRYTINLSCIVKPGDVNMTIHDISMHGLSILGNSKFDQYQQIDVSIEPENHEPLLVRGTIRNMIDIEDNTRYGLSIQDSPETWLQFVYEHALADK